MTDIQATPDGDTAWHSGKAFIILPPSEDGGAAAAAPVFFPRPSPVQAIWLKESGPVQRTGA
ncbi:hypothetical protein A8B82_21440 [Sulfitobacter sp. EhC04]|uniref:hypothetical protein n=1 Tax=Sulfitobacter sp. EhC04 TaxID=1849168 RepID=UPI0007F5248B|nr:hypothetical protein [Sulfitobacter sp. EhC04]OAN71154.1 hypothetical protein A8B82_21440 [Sulfitobacter sp. EhC04]